MIKKKKQNKSKIVHFPFDISDAIRKILRRNRGLSLCVSLGLVFAVILLLSLLIHNNASVSSHEVVEISNDPGGVNAQDPSMGTLDTQSQTVSGQSIASATDMILVTVPPTSTPTPTPKPTPTPAPTPTPTPTPTPIDFDALINFYKLEADQYYNDCGYSTNRYEYTDDELNMLAQLIYGEARGESLKGKIAVGNVVMNRVLSRGYPGDTIEAVITAPGQFTGYSSSIKPDSACIFAAREVFDKEVWVIPQNVYFFHSDQTSGEDWGSHNFYTEIGNHCFYTENYSGRNRNGKIPPALYQRAYKWPQYGCEPGKRVYRIQYMLNKLGYDVKADSYFGKTTKEALIAFQTKKKMKADGVAGPMTLKALIKAFGENEYCTKFL